MITFVYTNIGKCMLIICAEYIFILFYLLINIVVNCICIFLYNFLLFYDSLDFFNHICYINITNKIDYKNY